MAFWATTILICLGTAGILIAALRTRGGGLSGAASDLVVYRDQLKEIDRDVSRGVLGEAEAEAARIEVSRRLLDADRRATEARSVSRGAAWPAAALVAALVAAAFAIYAYIGAPGYRDLPIEARIAAAEARRESRPSQEEAERAAGANLPPAAEPEPRFAALMQRLREAVAERPDDVQGLRLLAGNELRLGNVRAAREAQDRLVAALGDEATGDDLLRQVEILVFAAGGYVSPEAEASLSRLLRQAAERPEALYYAGLLEAQIGRYDRAFRVWRRLLETGPEGAPWLPVIRAQITEIAAAAGVDYTPPAVAAAPRGPGEADVAAAAEMTADERQEMIRGMVEGLAERLATEGGPVEDWARLIGALGVLGERERAAAIAAEARAVFGEDAEAIATIAAAETRAGLTR